MNGLAYMVGLIQSGFGNLVAYLTAPVILCLLPAFFLGGALMALFPKEAVTNYLGRETPKRISYPAALVAGFVLAVCPCTLLPLFASIYKKGAGLGPAITFIFFAPASNLLALLFIGAQLGVDVAIARLILSTVFAIAIGLIMARIFRSQEQAPAPATDAAHLFAQGVKIPARTWVFFGLLAGVLIAGTLRTGLLQDSFAAFTLPAQWASPFQAWLAMVAPPSPLLGSADLDLQGAVLIGLLALIAVTGWKGLGKIDEEISAWTYVALGLLSLAPVVAALSVTVTAAGLSVGLTGQMVAEAALIAALWWMAVTRIEQGDVREWLWQVWRFVRQIIPLLLVGTFLAGSLAPIIPASWMEALAGRNTLLANLVAVVLALVVLPKLVEVPVAQAFVALGMDRGPLLSYLVGHAVLNPQPISITRSVLGKKQAAVYAVLAGLFSLAAGLIFGVILR